ncbi:VOC family protein [Microlunatus speluncae]|uniref:VOC family protein n=1 Tax=Microlunatus speluncae TaxID=2594267 RepID=UPI0012666146|nr:VOC family protein [Microlunatus speluncae]
MIAWLTAFLDGPADTFGESVRFWQRVTGSALSAYRGDAGQFATLLPPDGDSYLRVQLTDSETPGHHLDLHVADVAPATERAARLGATITFTEPGLSVATSPGGFPFCLVTHHGERFRALPYGRPGSLVDQLCLDLPAARYDDETSFWSELTGWEHRPGSQSEFGYLVRPEGMPLRILFQRTGDPPETEVRAHLDLACADRETEATRHEALGARRLSDGAHWITCTDPAGRRYCLTARNPVTGRLPLRRRRT